MDETRLTEIEDLFDLVENMDHAEREDYWEGVVQAQQELITKVRRLKRALLACQERNHEVYIGT